MSEKFRVTYDENWLSFKRHWQGKDLSSIPGSGFLSEMPMVPALLSPISSSTPAQRSLSLNASGQEAARQKPRLHFSTGPCFTISITYPSLVSKYFSTLVQAIKSIPHRLDAWLTRWIWKIGT